MVHFAGEQATSLTQSADADNSTYAGAEQAAADITPPVVGQRASAGFAAAAELDRLGDSIAELAAHLHAATYRLLVMLAEFDRRGGWGGGFRSCAHLAELAHADQSRRGAREGSGRARALYWQPAAGQPSGPDVTSYAQQQADAIGLVAEWALGGGPVPADQSETVAAAFEQVAVDCDNEATEPNQAIASDARAVKCDNEAAAPEHESAVEPGREAPGRERAAVAPASPRKRPPAVGRAERFQVLVHVDAEALRAGSDSGQAVLAGGVRISAETCRRIACDASRVVMIHDKAGNVLDVGRRTRTVPTAIRRALEHRDRGCRFPGCGLRICHAHHIEHWADGGATKLTNMALLCARHHRAVHEEGFRVHMSSTGELTFTRPDGRPLPDTPATPRLPEDCIEQLVTAHEELGLEIDAWTPTPDWHGERLDLDYAIRVLRAR